jgi:hypothetical protein
MVYNIVVIIFNKKHVWSKEDAFNYANELVKLNKNINITECDEFYYVPVLPKYMFNTKIYKQDNIDNIAYIISCPLKRKFIKTTI